MKIKVPCEFCRFPVITDPGKSIVVCTDCTVAPGRNVNWAKSLNEKEKEALIQKECQKFSDTQQADVVESESVDGCSTHPKYGGKRKPRTDCKGCWSWYEGQKT